MSVTPEIEQKILDGFVISNKFIEWIELHNENIARVERERIIELLRNEFGSWSEAVRIVEGGD